MSAQTHIARAKEVFDCEIEGLRRVRDSLGEPFAKTVELMVRCLDDGGKIVVTGVGKSLHVAEKISAILASTGSCSIVLNPVQAMHGDLGMTAAKDVLLALSFSGESEEIVRLIPAVRRHGLKVVALTGGVQSTLAGLSDIVLPIPCGPEACPFGMAPTTSTTATMAMGDALAMALIDARRFDKASYALNHPAGAIGRALLLKVTDVMRTGERVARVSPGATVLDTLLAMTKAQSGSAVVLDEAGILLGIFTDGDFRRSVSRIENGELRIENRGMPGDGSRTPEDVTDDSGQKTKDSQFSILNSPVGELMTRNPSFIRADAYAVDVLRVFEKRRIDDLPVCEENGKLLGVVDIQDLPRMKVL